MSGDYFENFAFFSPDRHNRKSITQIPGEQLNSLPKTWPGQIVVITETGGGYEADTVLLRNAADNSWLGMSGGKHMHNDDTDSAGGLFSDVLRANQGRVHFLQYSSPSTQDFSIFVSGGTTLTNIHDESRFSLATGINQGARCHGAKSGLGLSYNRRIAFQFKGYVTGDSRYMSVRIGVNMEDVLHDHNPDRKFGLEACDSAGVARTYDLVSASGSVRDIVTTTEDVGRSTPRSYMLQHFPGSNVRFSLNGAFHATNPNNVASLGGGSGSRNISFGVRTNNTVEKIMYCYGVALAGHINDPTWFWLTSP